MKNIIKNNKKLITSTKVEARYNYLSWKKI